MREGLLKRAINAGARRLIPSWRSRPVGFLPKDILKRIDESQLLFIHIPKNAGTTISGLLYGRGIKHRPAIEIAAFHPLRFIRAIKFAVVRDPFERFVSAFDYLRRGGKNEKDEAFGRRYLSKHEDINTFVASLAGGVDTHRVMSYFHFRPQCDYVTAGGLLLVNRLIPMNKLQSELSEIFGFKINLPQENRTLGKRTDVSVLEASSCEYLRRVYRRDFYLFELALKQRRDLFGRRLSSAVGPLVL